MADKFRATVALDIETEGGISSAIASTQQFCQFGAQYNHQVKVTVLKVELVVPADQSSQK